MNSESQWRLDIQNEIANIDECDLDGHWFRRSSLKLQQLIMELLLAIINKQTNIVYTVTPSIKTVISQEAFMDEVNELSELCTIIQLHLRNRISTKNILDNEAISNTLIKAGGIDGLLTSIMNNQIWNLLSVLLTRL